MPALVLGSLNMKLMPRLIAAATLSGLALPWVALAATPQMALNAALLRLADQKAGQIHLSASVQVDERPLTSTGRKTKADVAFSLHLRNELGIDGKLDGTGSVKLDRYKVESDQAGQSVSLDGPLTLEWSDKDNMAYLRLGALPQSIVDYFQGIGTDIQVLEGTWIGVESDRGAINDLLGTSLKTSWLDSQLLTDNKTIFTRYPPVQVTRVEKRWKAADGDSMIRLRARLNPRLVTALYNRDLAQINSDYRAKKITAALRLTRITALNKDLNEARRASSGLTMAINMNETEARIERIEVGGKFSLPQQTCTWNSRLQRSTCKNTSLLNVNLLIGISIEPASGQPIEHPAYWRPYAEVLKLLEPKRLTEEADIIP